MTLSVNRLAGLACALGMMSATSFAATLTVNSTADNIIADGMCTLREAMQAANGSASNDDCGTADPGLDQISFSIAGAGPHTIMPLNALPTVVEPVVIDGTTQPGASCSSGIEVPIMPANLLIELNGVNVPNGIDGIRVTVGGSTIRGLTINRFTRNGILLDTGGGNTIQCNHIGTNVAGSAMRPNGTGTMGIPGVVDTAFDGVFIAFSANNRVGGSNSGEGNVISGNINDGINIYGLGADNNVVEGNLIGPDATGINGIGNGDEGIEIQVGPIGNRVGGVVPGARNVISGNLSDGIDVQLDAADTRIQGNYIGVDATGASALPNVSGIETEDAAVDTLIGGATAAARNIISGNLDVGVVSDDDALRTLIEGNYIGLDATGMVAIPNQFLGISVDDQAVDTMIRDNVISGNGDASPVGFGIAVIFGATGTIIQGNLVGLNQAGSAAVPNEDAGIMVELGSSNTLIGGTETDDRNIISGNMGPGIIIGESDQNLDVQIIGNYIGTGTDFNDPHPNTDSGILIADDNSTLEITNNIVANNAVAGIEVVNMATVSENTDNCIFANAQGLLNTTGVETLAAGNFWGAADGPAPIGSGNSISADVSLGMPPDFRTALGGYCVDSSGNIFSDGFEQQN